MNYPQAPHWVADALLRGAVIPAHPLALSEDGRLDLVHQRALTRYYAAAGAGGVAVGVHTTQFTIRDPAVNLLRPVLQCAAAALDEIERSGGKKLLRVAGICGPTAQAVAEAKQAAELGYHVGLLSLSAMKQASLPELMEHCRQVAGVMPLMGFYLQPAVGGRLLPFDFWKEFAAIPNVVSIKMAPFNRYQTLDVIRGVAHSGRADRIALYTGNDDNIIPDLLTKVEVNVAGRTVALRMAGGLLGHWAVWTRRVTQLFAELRPIARADEPIFPRLLTLGAQVTDANAALFDVAHNFAGCIAGIQHVLHGQGLLASPRCLDEREVLSPGQADEIRRVRQDYPHLIDDDFVKANLPTWLA